MVRTAFLGALRLVVVDVHRWQAAESVVVLLNGSRRRSALRTVATGPLHPTKCYAFGALPAVAQHTRTRRARTRQRATAPPPQGARLPGRGVPIGYTVENVIDGPTVVTRRVIDPITAPTDERVFALIEAGHTPATSLGS